VLKAENLLILLLISVATGCLTSGGIEEPYRQVCTILSDNDAECIIPGLSNEPIDIKLDDMIGYQCASPENFSIFSSHHEILHREVNRLRDKK